MKMKKILTVFVALTAVLAISVLAFAQAGPGGPENVVQNSSSAISDLPEQANEMANNRNRFNQKMDEIQAKREEIQNRNEEFASKREEFEAYRNMIRERVQTAVGNMQENNRLRAENARLYGELKGSLEQLREQGFELSEESMASMEGYMEQIRLLREELKDTQGQIGNIARNNAQLRKNRDYASLEASLDEATAVQEYRNECLTQINEHLSLMLRELVSEA
jgi:chromosome segregation ATPase